MISPTGYTFTHKKENMDMPVVFITISKPWYGPLRCQTCFSFSRAMVQIDWGEEMGLGTDTVWCNENVTAV